MALGRVRQYLQRITTRDDPAAVLHELCTALLQLVDGTGPFEAFGIEAYSRDSAGKGAGVGLRVRLDHPGPVTRSTDVKIFADLHPIDRDDWANLEEWQKFSIIQMNNSPNCVPFMMLGPIALINHHCKDHRGRWIKEKSRTILKITRKIVPGQELFIQYSRDYECEGSCCST